LDPQIYLQKTQQQILLIDMKWDFWCCKPNKKKKNLEQENSSIKYNYKSDVTIGKQLLTTSFINLQDGRMRPTLVNGIWIDYNEIQKTKINLGYL
jgi:hypothetical protein